MERSIKRWGLQHIRSSNKHVIALARTIKRQGLKDWNQVGKSLELRVSVCIDYRWGLGSLV